jgi:hypothetical protein
MSSKGCAQVNYSPQSGWPDFKPLKGGEKSKDTSVPVALPQGTTTRGSGFLEDNKNLTVAFEVHRLACFSKLLH